MGFAFWAVSTHGWLVSSSSSTGTPQATLSEFLSQSVLVSGIAPVQVQPLAFGLVEPHQVLMGPLLISCPPGWHPIPSVSFAKLMKDSLLKFLLSIWDRSCPPVTDIKHNNQIQNGTDLKPGKFTVLSSAAVAVLRCEQPCLPGLRQDKPC